MTLLREESAGPPRSVVWRGGAAHLRSGRGGRGVPDPHAHFAIQITVGLDAEVCYRSSRRAVERIAPGWIAGSDIPHWGYSPGLAAIILLDGMLESGRRVAARLGGAHLIALSESECAIVRREMEQCWQPGWKPPDIRAAVERTVELLAPGALPPDPVDPRVREVIGKLVLDSSENVSLAALAAGTGLSEGRLAHLFRRDVGMPMRQYRLGLRMEQAVRRISEGNSLTEAAHAAGFSDSAHFCRICRRMFGTAPSDLPEFEIAG